MFLPRSPAAYASRPMGAYAAWRGFAAMNVGDPRDRTMATAGVVSGGVSALISGMFVVFWLLYLAFIALYFVFIFVLIGAGAMSGPPS